MEGIILKKNVFSEGSEVITIYSRELGKIRVVARSVKSPKSKLSFGLQQLFRSDLEFAQRGGKLSGNLETITGVKVLETFMNLRESEKAVNDAFYATELILKATADQQPNQNLYDLYLEFLRHLDAQPDGSHPCAGRFVIHALGQLGFALDFQHCIICRNHLDRLTNSVYFSASRGGLVCGNCSKKVANVFVIEPEIYQALSQLPQLGAADFDRAVSIAASVSTSTSNLHKIANAFSENVLERDLKTARFI